VTHSHGDPEHTHKATTHSHEHVHDDSHHTHEHKESK
jgi:hypothetical protein